MKTAIETIQRDIIVGEDYQGVPESIKKLWKGLDEAISNQAVAAYRARLLEKVESRMKAAETWPIDPTYRTLVLGEFEEFRDLITKTE